MKKPHTAEASVLRLKALRWSARKTAFDVARAAEISTGRYSYLERRLLPPTREERERLAVVLGAPAATLFRPLLRASGSGASEPSRPRGRERCRGAGSGWKVMISWRADRVGRRRSGGPRPGRHSLGEGDDFDGHDITTAPRPRRPRGRRRCPRRRRVAVATSTLVVARPFGHDRGKRAVKYGQYSDGAEAIADDMPPAVRLGHHSAAFTLKVYGHAMPQGDRRAVEALDTSRCDRPQPWRNRPHRRLSGDLEFSSTETRTYGDAPSVSVQLW